MAGSELLDDLFAKLHDLEAGDIIEIRFMSDAFDNIQLILDANLNGCVALHRYDATILDGICQSRRWPVGGDLKIKLTLPNEEFDPAQFAADMRGGIDQLKLTRGRPLIDPKWAETTDVVHYRFKPNAGLDALAIMHDLHDMGVLSVTGLMDLEDAFLSGAWTEEARQGTLAHTFTPKNIAFRAHFNVLVLPHLELLRPERSNR